MIVAESSGIDFNIPALVLAVVLLALNGFFVAGEFALLAFAAITHRAARGRR